VSSGEYGSDSPYRRDSGPSAVPAAIRRFVGRHARPARGTGVLLAVSGGADSMALLRAMQTLAARFDWRLHVAHLDHGLRGADGAADAAFVRATAEALGLPMTLGTADVREQARDAGISIEMAARGARYDFLAATATANGATGIVTAHTADDQAETVLLRMVRGCGLAGLKGIPAVGKHHGLPLLRPLLTVSRGAIEAYLHAVGQPWHEDASNADPAHQRNRVRHEVLPLLADRLNPRVGHALCRLADQAATDEALLAALATERLTACRTGNGALRVTDVRASPPALRGRMLVQWLHGCGLSSAYVTEALVTAIVRLCRTTDGSRRLDPGGGFRLCRDYDQLRLERPDAPPATAHPALTPVAVPGVTRLPALGLTVLVERTPGVRKDSAGRIGDYPRHASLRGDVPLPLHVRPRRPGDRMAPWGMDGSRKVQDILVDARVPAAARSQIPVFETGGEIVWIPGYRVSRAGAVTDPAAPNLQLTVVLTDPGAANG